MLGRLGFRHRIWLLVTLAGFGLVVVMVVTQVLGRRTERELSGIENRYVPLIEVNRDLQLIFSQLTRAFEDAASAAEASRLGEADELERQFEARLHSGEESVADNGGDLDSLRRDFRTYYTTARDVSAAMVRGTAPNALAPEIDKMNGARQAFSAHLTSATTPDRPRLAAAFATARRSQENARSIEIVASVVVLAVMALLSWRIIHRTVKSLRDVSSGVERLAEGDVDTEIAVTTDDELGALAREANRTTIRLRAYRQHNEALLTETQWQADQVRQASAAKSEFLSSMSHELRTPLNAVLGFAQLLDNDRKEPLTPRQKERVQHLLRGGEHLLKLIDDVLDLSGIESGRLSVSCASVELRGLLQDVASTLAPMAARAKIELDVGPLPEDLPTIVADPTRLKQILVNFGSNAIKYGKPGGHATLKASDLGGNVQITVIDDGIGIPKDKQGKVFEPFERAGQENGPIDGTGIGLAITKRLAAMMNGSVGFASEPGQGSSFWVLVPARDAHTTEAGATSKAARRASPLAAKGPRHKVVYVEDNPSSLAFMAELIDDLQCIELLTASTAEIGIEVIRAHCPKVVLMDINLPGMNGFDALERLRASPETCQIPIVGLSAAATAMDTARATRAGFHRYLTKPVRVDELISVLEELLVPQAAPAG